MFQGRGIAKELFSFAEQKAKELTFWKLSLLVDFEIEKQSFWWVLGFQDNEILKVSGSNFSSYDKRDLKNLPTYK